MFAYGFRRMYRGCLTSWLLMERMPLSPLITLPLLFWFMILHHQVLPALTVKSLSTSSAQPLKMTPQSLCGVGTLNSSASMIPLKILCYCILENLEV